MAEPEVESEVAATSANGTGPVEDKGETNCENKKEHGGEEVVEKAEAAKVKEEHDPKVEKVSVEDGENEEKGSEEVGAQAEESKEVKGSKKRGRKSRKVVHDGKVKENEPNKKMPKNSNTLAISTVERPSRERKSIQRFVISNEKDPAKELFIEKGRGIPLKDIPNVAYKLSKRKTDETLKNLHLILFGRRGKAFHVKSVISQFSGFVWKENEEKQRTKIKERLDKCNKDQLLDFCDVLDIPVSKTAHKKDEVVVKLVEFMEAPHATTDILLSEKEQSKKSKKRRRRVKRSASKRTGDALAKGSVKKRRKTDATSKAKEKCTSKIEDEDEGAEDEENENGVTGVDDYETPEGSASEESEEPEEEDDEDYGKSKSGSKKSLKSGSAQKTSMKKARTPKRTPVAAPSKSPTKASSKHPKSEDKDDSSRRQRRKKNDGASAKKFVTPKEKTKEKTGKRTSKGKDKSGETKESGPSEEELRKAICDILKEVDFNTATFTDILKKLAAHFDVDLTPRKPAVKMMIQEELTKLADEAEENEEDEEEEKETKTEKVDKDEEERNTGLTDKEEERNNEKKDEEDNERNAGKTEEEGERNTGEAEISQLAVQEMVA